MKKILMASLFAGLLPVSSLACSPVIGADKMSEKELLQWNEANPCFMNHDEKVYNETRKMCIKEKIKNTGLTFEQYVQTPPPGSDVITSCNHKAFEESKRN